MTLKGFLKSCGLGSQVNVDLSKAGRAIFLSPEGDILAYVPAKHVGEGLTQKWVSEAMTWPVREDLNGHMCAQPGGLAGQSFNID